MIIRIFATGFLLLSIAVDRGPALAQENSASPESESTADTSIEPEQDEDPDVILIRAAIASYTAAFNKQDAAAVAEHFSEDGELTTSGGATFKGRTAVQQSLETYFQTATNAQLALADVSVNVIAPRVAIESGTAIITTDQQTEESTYRAVHVKDDQGWTISRIQDDPVTLAPPSNYSKLQPLEWLVGSWQLDSDASSLQLNCRWTTNQNFLVVSYQSAAIEQVEQVDFQGTVIIGWDPSLEVIRSWNFDSDGGFGSGSWSSTGDAWTVKTINVVPDGSQATATHIYRPLDETTMEYRSVGRQVAGKLLGNVPAAQFTRIP